MKPPKSGEVEVKIGTPGGLKGALLRSAGELAGIRMGVRNFRSRTTKGEKEGRRTVVEGRKKLDRAFSVSSESPMWK